MQPQATMFRRWQEQLSGWFTTEAQQRRVLGVLLVLLLFVHLPLETNRWPLAIAIGVVSAYFVLQYSGFDYILRQPDKLILGQPRLFWFSRLCVWGITGLLLFYKDTSSLWVLYVPLVLLISLYTYNPPNLFTSVEVIIAAAIGRFYEVYTDANPSLIQYVFEPIERALTIAISLFIVYILVSKLKEYAKRLDDAHTASYRFQISQAGDLLKTIADEAVKILKVGTAAVFPVATDISTGEMHLEAGVYSNSAEYMLYQLDASVIDKVNQYVLAERKYFYHVRDIPQSDTEITKDCTNPFIAVPLISISDNTLLGILFLVYDRPQDLDENWKNIIRIFAEQAEAAIAVNRSSRQEVRQSIRMTLHDSIKSTASGQTFFIEKIERALKQPTPDFGTIQSNLHKLRHSSQHIVHDTQLILESISPDAQDKLSWVKIIQDEVNRMSVGRSQLHLAIDEHLPSPNLSAASSVLYLIREGIMNAVKHGHAESIHVRVRCQDDFLQIRIHDDGKGFDPNIPPQPGHYGLNFMRERVASLGASLEIQSAPGQGTTIAINIPL
jgi:signal transduction histidine kinase